jgi:hypothetical protein
VAFRPELPTAIVRYPESPIHPIRVGFEGVEIEAAIASREALKTFAGLEEYQERGVYVLIGPPTSASHRRSARAGEAGSRKLDARLRDHLAIPPDDSSSSGKTLLGWESAALFRRLTRAFERHETGVLEALLHAELERAIYVERAGNRNIYEASDDALQRDLQRRVLPALLVGLRLAGLDLRTSEDVDAEAQAPARHRPGADS